MDFKKPQAEPVPNQLVQFCQVDGKQTKQCEILKNSGGNQRVLASTSGLCYTFNKLDHTRMTKTEELDMVRSAGEYAGVELILDIDGNLQL